MDKQLELSGEKLSSLDILSVLKTGKEFSRERELIDMFKDESVTTTDGLLSGMKKDIEGRIIEENTTRKLDTVESDFKEGY